MSDTEYEPTPEDIATWQGRDERVREVMEAIDLETDMRDNKTIVTLQRAIKARYDLAVDELCETSPADEREVSRLLVNIKTFVYMRKIFEAILTRGTNAERSLRDEERGQ